MNKEKILGIVRHILTFGGGLVVTKGWADEATVLSLVGAAVAIVGGVWSIMAPEKANA